MLLAVYKEHKIVVLPGLTAVLKPAKNTDLPGTAAKTQDKSFPLSNNVLAVIFVLSMASHISDDKPRSGKPVVITAVEVVVLSVVVIVSPLSPTLTIDPELTAELPFTSIARMFPATESESVSGVVPLTVFSSVPLPAPAIIAICVDLFKL